MNKITCEECMAYCICPQKPKRKDYADENKYLIDLECGVWSCKNTVQELCKENAKLKEQIEKMKNCGNCKNIVNGIRTEKCKHCFRDKNFSDWELAE